MKKMLFLTIIAMLSCGAFAANNNWSAGGDGSSWSDSANWSLGVVPQYSLHDAYIGNTGDNANYSVVLDTTGEANQFKVGVGETAGGTYQISIEDTGTLELARLYVGLRGAVNINGGSMNFTGDNLDGFVVQAGSVNIYDGTIEIANAGWRLDVATSIVRLYGGTLRIHNGTMFSRQSGGLLTQKNAGFLGKMDFRGGQLVMDGDCRVALQWHIGNGNIMAFGSVAGAVTMVYDDIENTTTVTASANAWTAGGDGVSWSDTSNWSSQQTPDFSTDTYIGIGGENANYDVIIDGAAISGSTRIGIPETAGGSYVVSVETGGYYEIYRMYLGKRGTVNINGGDMEFTGDHGDAFVVGAGTVNINSGSLTIGNSAWRILNDGSNIGTVNLYGGQFRIFNGTKFSNYSGDVLTKSNSNFTGVINIHEGELVFDGDCRIAVQSHIEMGNFIAYDGDPEYRVDSEYDSATDTTTVSAAYGAAAVYTWPHHNLTLTVDQRQTIQLNWEKSPYVGRISGFNVYIQDPNDTELQLESDSVVPYRGTTWQLSVALGGTYFWRIDQVLEDSTVITGNIRTVNIAEELLTVYEIEHEGINALDWQWIACGDGRSWNDELNWHSEVDGEPIPAYNGYEGTRSTSRMPYSTTIVDWYSLGGNYFVGHDGLEQWLQINDGGYLQLYRTYNSEGGTITIDDESNFQTVHFISNGGITNLYGYMRIIGQYWSFKKTTTGRGALRLFDGRLVIDTMATEPFAEEETGNIDIHSGQLEIAGDYLSTVQGWVNDGHIISYSGVDPNSPVDVYYDAELDLTIATARPSAYKAYNPYPNKQTDVATDSELSWFIGDNIDSETLYLATLQKSDLNKDGYVDFDDLVLLASNYVDDSWQAVAGADATGDNEVNLLDFAALGADWLESFGYQAIDTFTRDPNVGDVASYSILLEGDTEYRWRVDSELDSKPYTGNVWTFKTGAAAKAAFNSYPVDGDNNIDETTAILEWQLPAGISSADVYFGTSYNGITYQTTTSSNNWTTATLDVNTRYYWRIDTLEGATTHTGKVWTFKTTDSPMGLRVDGGVLKLGNQPFKGYGVNYITALRKVVDDQADTSYEQGFAVLGENNIPFVRMWSNGMYVRDWQLYLEDKERYFELFDNVMASAEENGVGVVFSLFWTWYTLADIAGENISEWGNPASQTCALMETYVRDIYNRYKNCPAFWGWELGNEYNYADNVLAPTPLPVRGHPATRDNTLDRMSISLARDISANFEAVVRKVDKNRIISNGFGLRATGVEYDDYASTDVASIHYYPYGGDRDLADLVAASSTASSWGKPLFVGEFGASETQYGAYATVEAAFDNILSELQTANVVFAAVWVYDYDKQSEAWNITGDNYRGYMLDKLEAANAALNQ